MVAYVAGCEKQLLVEQAVDGSRCVGCFSKVTGGERMERMTKYKDPEKEMDWGNIKRGL